ncbi:TonB-dependent receptor plug domain-containing protein [Mesonia maritima]|uniref:TonB-dependent receptor plug domain-containing protein n=1 Tax=Mesonia maritima TaxID=1793873 RepID=UPI00362F08C8
MAIKANQTTTVNGSLGSSAAALDAVMIKAVGRKDSEVALLLQQKDAVDIKESIGSQELAKMGVSDAATATSKISGVSASEGSGEVYVRGLGDRYLYTTLNGLPIPSDDIENKNIDLELFPTRVVESVSISKTYSASTSADQASGNVNIDSRSLTGTEELNISTRLGINTNAMQDGVRDNFKRSPNSEDMSFGFYSKNLSSKRALTEQTWNAQTTTLPINYRHTFRAGKKLGENFKVFLTGSQTSNYEYQSGLFQQYQNNYLDDYFNDIERFKKTINTTGLIDLGYKFNSKNNIRALSLFINKVTDEVYEAGRNGEGFVFEETDTDEGLSQFVRDQNIKQTRLWVNQLLGEHKIGESNNLEWGIGYNLVNADEPNRIRNEINFNEQEIELARMGGYQQRKSLQYIDDTEYNGRLSDEFKIINKDSLGLSIKVGGNYRNKERDFKSQFFGLSETEKGFLNPASLDNLSSVLTQENIDNGYLMLNEQGGIPDTYNAVLESRGAFLTTNFKLNRFNFNVGARFQKDNIDVKYDVGNAPGGRKGEVNKVYDNIYPSLNVKYSLNEENNFRLAGSKTITLPEFKEFAPFEYVDPTGLVTRGNRELEASTAYNLDLKWEFFPTSNELISLTGFYKLIEEPINKAQTRSASGVFSYFNSSNEGKIYGLELEANINILEANVETEEGINLDFGANVTRMWHTQDLKEFTNEQGRVVNTFRYNNKKDVGLQGASDWILNASLNFSTSWENPFIANLSANYASDKIFALGRAPLDQEQSDVLYNDSIIEKGFVVLNLTITQDLSENWTLRFTGKNLLNPEIERTQNVRPAGGTQRTETVSSYTRGAVLSLGVSYNL